MPLSLTRFAEDGLSPIDEGPLADRVEQGLAARKLGFGACRNNEELRRRRSLGPAEDGRGDVRMARVSVRFR